MKTTEEKLRQIHRGCDKVVDEFDDGYYPRPPGDSYERGKYDLAKEIMDIIEEE